MTTCSESTPVHSLAAAPSAPVLAAISQVLARHGRRGAPAALDDSPTVAEIPDGVPGVPLPRRATGPLRPDPQPGGAPPAEPGSGPTDLLGEFVTGTDGARNAVVVSADGLLLAEPPARTGDARQLAAVVAGIVGLAGGASRAHPLGNLRNVIIDLSDGYVLATSTHPGVIVGVIAAKTANLDTVGCAMTLLANQVGAARVG